MKKYLLPLELDMLQKNSVIKYKAENWIFDGAPDYPIVIMTRGNTGYIFYVSFMEPGEFSTHRPAGAVRFFQ